MGHQLSLVTLCPFLELFGHILPGFLFMVCRVCGGVWGSWHSVLRYRAIGERMKVRGGMGHEHWKLPRNASKATLTKGDGEGASTK